MADLDLDAIEARAAAATEPTDEGGWMVEGGSRWDVYSGKQSDMSTDIAGFIFMRPDADFIAAARADVPALVAEVRRLRTALMLSEESAASEAFHHPVVDLPSDVEDN
jgi:hypothetical protein